jgi:beta-lactamase regulating signal transducer with metallopeptidase domain
MNAWMADFLSGSLAQRVGWALIHSLWQGTAVALLLAGAMRLLRGRSPQLRWALACAALALMVAMPAVTACVAGGGEAAEGRPGVGVVEPAGAARPPEPSMALPAAAQHSEADGDAIAPPPWRGQVEAAVHRMLPWVLGVWLAGVAALSLWHLGGWLLLERIKSRGTYAVGQDIRGILDGLLVRMGVRRAVRLLKTAGTGVPIVIGWLRPVILLPVGAVTGLTPRQLEAILAHELAHVRRWDCLAQTLQAVLETLLFYHPAVWWVSRQIRQEGERCCDDVAVGVCGDHTGYALALARAAELATARRPAFAAAANAGNLLGRIRRIVGLPDRRGDRRAGWLAGAIVLAGLVVAAMGIYGCSQRRSPAQPNAAANSPAGPPGTRPSGQWGPAAEGMRLRLSAHKSQWRSDEPIAVLAHLRNGGTKPVEFVADGVTGWEVEVDGRWYGQGITTQWSSTLPPGQETLLGVGVQLTSGKGGRKIWFARTGTAGTLEMAPGKHAVRVGVTVQKASKPLRVESSALEIDVLPAATAPSAGPPQRRGSGA